MKELLEKNSKESKDEKERMLKRELRYTIERFIRDKGESDSMLFDAKVVKESLKMEGNSDEYKTLIKSVGKSKANDFIYKKHKLDATISVFNKEYPGVIEVLLNQIKKNGGYYEY